MKHRIDAPLGSAEFREAFLAIRNGFIAKLDEHLAGRSEVAFRACNSTGTPFAWVWDDDQFRNVGMVGSLADAKSFIANMIDEGMQFAFLGSKKEGGVEVWLTTWEAPEHGPNWPQSLVCIFEEVHEGVVLG